MKNIKCSIDDTKTRLSGMRGVDMLLRVNLGRNKIVEYNGKVEDLYASVFTVKAEENEAIKTYSYSDVLTGNIKFFGLRS